MTALPSAEYLHLVRGRVSPVDGLNQISAELGVDVSQAEAFIGGPWNEGEDGPGNEREFTTFTGRENPRTPGRPLIALRIDHLEKTAEVAHAVGVPAPDGKMRWAMGEPRTLMPIELDELESWAREHARFDVEFTEQGLKEMMLAELANGISKVADVAMMRGATWE